MTVSWSKSAVFWLAALSVVDHSVGKTIFCQTTNHSFTLLVKTVLTERLSYYYNKMLLCVATKIDAVKNV